MKQVTAILIALFLGVNSFGQKGSNKELKKDIDALFESYAHYNRFVGSVLISENNTIIYQQSFGYADIAGKKRIPKTRYLVLPRLPNH